jgi:hypothetical protein
LQQSVLILCLAFLYQAHTCFNGGVFARFGMDGTPASGIGTASSAEGAGNIVCNTTRINTDAILPRALDNDPFLAFLSLTTLLAPPSFLTPVCAALRHRCFSANTLHDPNISSLYPGCLARSQQLLC